MAFKRNGRRDGPTTLRTVNGHELGAKPPPSGKAMQRAVDDRRAGQVIRDLLPKLRNKHHNHVVAMLAAGETGRAILQWLEGEGVIRPDVGSQ